MFHMWWMVTTDALVLTHVSLEPLEHDLFPLTLIAAHVGVALASVVVI